MPHDISWLRWDRCKWQVLGSTMWFSIWCVIHHCLFSQQFVVSRLISYNSSPQQKNSIFLSDHIDNIELHNYTFLSKLKISSTYNWVYMEQTGRISLAASPMLTMLSSAVSMITAAQSVIIFHHRIASGFCLVSCQTSTDLQTHASFLWP